jgi:hypothetical protein
LRKTRNIYKYRCWSLIKKTAYDERVAMPH